jgi:hypothetical protein
MLIPYKSIHPGESETIAYKNNGGKYEKEYDLIFSHPELHRIIQPVLPFIFDI